MRQNGVNVLPPFCDSPQRACCRTSAAVHGSLITHHTAKVSDAAPVWAADVQLE